MASGFFQDGWWKQWIPGWNIVDMIDGFTHGQYRTGIGQIDFNDLGLNASSSDNKELLSYDDFNGDMYAYLAYLDKYGSEADHDRFINYITSEASQQGARDWTAAREDSQYQRLVADLKKAGINPYALMSSGGSPVSSSANGVSYGGAYSSNEVLKKESNQQKWVQLISSILSTVIIASIMMA